MSLLQRIKNILSGSISYTPSKEVKEHLVKNHGSVAKKAISLIAAGTLSFGLVACAPKASQNNTDPNPNPGVVTPGPESQYSSIMQDVLTDSYYQQLNKKYQNGSISENEKKPIPYRLLSAHGHDIDKIKSDELACEVNTYTKKDDNSTLYVSVKVDNTNNSITNYLVTYPLTEQEYEEYSMLHRGHYIQAPFYIQELDNQKDANVISAINIDKNSYENFLEKIVGVYYRSFNISAIQIDLTNLTSTTDFTVLVRETVYSNKEMRYIPQRTFNYHFYNPVVVNNSLLINNVDDCIITNREEVLNSYETLYYFTPHINQNNIYTK